MLILIFFIFQNFQSEFIKILYQNDNIDGFLVRFGDYIIVIICYDDYYYFFDLYVRDVNGFFDQVGKVVVIYFLNFVFLCRYFQ